MRQFTREEIIMLAALAAADYAASCSGPTIRGRNGEIHLRGSSIEEVAARNDLTVEEAKTLTVDLSTATFDELPPHWQRINIESAEGMIALMAAMGGPTVIAGLDLNDPDTRLRYGTMLHQLWLQQPANSSVSSELKRPFRFLDPAEQDKDIQQLISLQKWLSVILS